VTWHRTTLARAFFAEAGAEGNASTAAANALRRYFAGELEAPDSIAVATSATELQEKAWAALRREHGLPTASPASGLLRAGGAAVDNPASEIIDTA